MRLIMNPGHYYTVYGKNVRPGDEFEVPDKEADLWQRLGRARAKAMAAEEDPPPRRGPGRPRKDEASGRYLRADMRAEDE